MSRTRTWIAATALVSAVMAGLIAWRLPPGTDCGRLVVLAEASFSSPYGPGPELARVFESQVGCQAELVDAGDAGLMVEKLKLLDPDVIMGVDQLSLSLFNSNEFVLIDAERPSDWPAVGGFQPYNWAPLAFVGKRSSIPENLRGLADLVSERVPDGSLALQDPRTSSPGLQLFFWVLDEFGVDKGFDFLNKLKTKTHSVSPSWSKAYGMMSAGQAPLAFSYITSPVYHQLEEKSDDFAALVFSDAPHPIQVEYLGQRRSTGLADAWVRLVFSVEGQGIIMRRNYMLPVRAGVANAPPWSGLQLPPRRVWRELDRLLAERRDLLKRWESIGP